MRARGAVFGSEANVPLRLSERADQLLNAVGDTSSAGLLDAARDTAARAMNAGSGDRAAALDVLVADALVTHAMGLMASQDGDFAKRCAEAMQHLAALVDEQ